nr:hypothetical protein [uncultured Acetatifactor sp.]
MERVRAGLRIPYDLNTWLIQEAQKQGIAKNALILQILWEWVRRERQETSATGAGIGGR